MDSMLGFYKYKNLDLRQIYSQFNFVDVDESSLLTFISAATRFRVMFIVLFRGRIEQKKWCEIASAMKVTCGTFN